MSGLVNEKWKKKTFKMLSKMMDSFHFTEKKKGLLYINKL